MDPNYFSLVAVFAQVARRASFSEAASELRLSTGTVSRKISELEQMLGVLLFERSTRKVCLTEIGCMFYDRSLQMLQFAEESSFIVQDLQTEPGGTLRITAPILFGTMHLGPLIRTFMDRHPKVRVELSVSDHLESLATGEHDIAIRITNHLDDTVVARRLATVNWAVCASPEYLGRRGSPAVPADLREHNCYHYPSVIKYGKWSFRKGDAEYTVPIRGRLQVNNSQIIADQVLAGMGIGLLPTYVVGEYMKTGQLIPLLQAYQPTVNSALYALYQPNRYMTGKVRRFIDLLRESIYDPPYWDSGIA
ncbi:hypothetical protein BTH42_32330 [Burkholderia sp. SRS-W-2-2016]|uniref:LysR family transcriptional regulator n=1 Tax=Burkholderia sp. SRS-W-2-2016 TaxID=1926878 RepID=UPI00094ABF63|nr:LysR family transcriptional regulator [Burkholderia sp. SRS-W-2-2016]OLL27526.1 hypothetical protein BTH42_32330 [Burkholderia sp. SRS-W-2-2016]